MASAKIKRLQKKLESLSEEDLGSENAWKVFMLLIGRSAYCLENGPTYEEIMDAVFGKEYKRLCKLEIKLQQYKDNSLKSFKEWALTREECEKMRRSLGMTISAVKKRVWKKVRIFLFDWHERNAETTYCFCLDKESLNLALDTVNKHVSKYQDYAKGLRDTIKIL